MADYVTHIKPAPGSESAPIKDSNAVRRDGDTMQADLSMGGFRLTDVGTPTSDTDAVPKSYADNMLPKSGGTMSGAIAMGSNKITDLADPTADADAATKSYIDNTFKWQLIGSWVYGGSLTADFTAYDELMFVYDAKNDGFVAGGGVTLHILTALLTANKAYLGVAYSAKIRFTVTITNASVSTYSATYDSSDNTSYKIYCYGR